VKRTPVAFCFHPDPCFLRSEVLPATEPDDLQAHGNSIWKTVSHLGTDISYRTTSNIMREHRNYSKLLRSDSGVNTFSVRTSRTRLKALNIHHLSVQYPSPFRSISITFPFNIRHLLLQHPSPSRLTSVTLPFNIHRLLV